MSKFVLKSDFKPSFDQEKAIKELSDNLKKGVKEQVLLGATGTGKTFTISNVITKIQKPTLVLAHNKTLAAQLYGEFKKLFPNNKVEYFVSNFDYYQPEAYVVAKDLYIDKVSQVNMDIELLQLSTMNSLQTFNDTIVISSVAAIYGRNNPATYKKMTMLIKKNDEFKRKDLITFLRLRGYSRNNLSNDPATFRVKGDLIEISPGWTDDFFVRIDVFGDQISSLAHIDKVTKQKIANFDSIRIYPAYGYVTTQDIVDKAVKRIKEDLKKRLPFFKKSEKPIEHQRLKERITRDVEDLKEFGTCAGIENYSMYLDERNPGDQPYSLFDYFPKDFLLIIDESHQMIPQIRGMYNGDRARKESLVDYGFRLPSALDNRPLRFEEFKDHINQVIYVSATPGDYELDQTGGVITEQIIRPTGLVDPKVIVVPNKNQIEKIYDEIQKSIKLKDKTLITTLTKKMAEDLSLFLKERGVKSAYLHSEIKTLERMTIINGLRQGKFDVLIGINLLREGLDIPEVATIHILDADKEGFLRSYRSLIQIIGRAARNVRGKVFMYANKISEAMSGAIRETKRRRKIQHQYNIENNITPQTIQKEVDNSLRFAANTKINNSINKYSNASKTNQKRMLDDLKKEMKQAAKNLDFETAAKLRDLIIELAK